MSAETRRSRVRTTDQTNFFWFIGAAAFQYIHLKLCMHAELKFYHTSMVWPRILKSAVASLSPFRGTFFYNFRGLARPKRALGFPSHLDTPFLPSHPDSTAPLIPTRRSSPPIPVGSGPSPPCYARHRAGSRRQAYQEAPPSPISMRRRRRQDRDECCVAAAGPLVSVGHHAECSSRGGVHGGGIELPASNYFINVLI